MYKVGDRVIVLAKFHGSIVNISDYREPSMKYCIDLDEYKDDYVFVGEKELTAEEATYERAD